MKIHTTALALTICGGLLVSTAAAQNTTTDRLDSKTSGTSVRASQLIGMNIENSSEKSVGEINDIVINSRTGEIQYVAVTYGGFLGLGNKMFAVPFEAFTVKRDPDDPNDANDLVLVLNVTEKQLEGAKGFDEDHWPSFADESFTNGLYKRYGVKRRWADRRNRGIDVRVNRSGVEVDVNHDN